jgi:NAD(P)-dependent dehydrogenase (short-subunit alcohol dehydrogenase family)
MNRCSGQAIILTSSTGIGAATARLLAAEGADLLIAGRDEEVCDALAAQTGATCWLGELLEPGAADSIVAHCLSQYGRVDGLFNVAGLSGRRFGDGPVHECSDAGWETAIEQNLTSTFRMCRAVAARMLEQKPRVGALRGSIVNMGSVLAVAPEPRHFATHAYAAAKGAVIAMSRSMAAAYAPHGIRVNVLAPGLVGTSASEAALGAPELRDFVKRKQPLADGMIGVEAIARAALFLLSDDSSAITGDVLLADGGWSVTGV